MAERLHQVGHAGEETAERHLAQMGYRILARNFRCRFGEIDLIAREGQTLVFIEVKTRRSRAFGPASLAVTNGKQRRLIKASQVYLSQRGGAQEVCRFDVVTIQIEAGVSQVEVIKNAFQHENV
ncbi:MAG: YraN family protein [Candidatus Entotheonellia bacterium]